MKTLKVLSNCCLVFLAVISVCISLGFCYYHFFVDDITMGVNYIDNQVGLDIEEKLKNDTTITDEKVLGIIFSLLFVGAFAFVLSWGIINFNKVKDGMSGTGVYTKEDLNKAYEDGYDNALTDKEEYTNLIASYRDTIITLNDNISQLNSQVTTLTNNNKDYANQIAQLNEQKTNLQSQVDNLNTIKVNNESLIETLNNEKQTLQNSLEEKISELNLTKEEVEQKENTIAELETTKANLQTEIENNKIEIEKLNQQIISLQNQIATNGR